MRATRLALGEVTYCRRFGFLMYPQRHGLCSRSLLQHRADGGADDVIADTHELSSVALHVTASTTLARSAKRSTSTATRAATSKRGDGERLDGLAMIFNGKQAKGDWRGRWGVCVVWPRPSNRRFIEMALKFFLFF